MECKTKTLLHVISLGLFIAATGCGDGGAVDGPIASVSSGQQTAPSNSANGTALPGKADTPTSAVATFLEAVRRGDRTAAKNMLTALAVQKTEEHNLNFSPPGSETARFQLGEATKLGPDVAEVACIWTDLDEDGNARPEQIRWSVKRAAGAWRISGMTAEIGPGETPIVIDFEQPEELIRRQQTAAEQSAQLAEPPERQASRPNHPFEGASAQ